MTALSRIVVPHPLAGTWPYKAISFARFDLAGNPRYTVGADKEEFGATAALVDALIRFGGQCFRCGVFSAPHALSKEQALHHVRAKDGAPESLENLMIVCGRCEPPSKCTRPETPVEEPARPSQVYPGELASVEQILALARDYRAAAETLAPEGQKLSKSLRPPYRLIAIHTIELYLNAILMTQGWTSAQLRGMQHDLAKRSAAVAETASCSGKDCRTPEETVGGP